MFSIEVTMISIDLAMGNLRFVVVHVRVYNVPTAFLFEFAMPTFLLEFAMACLLFVIPSARRAYFLESQVLRLQVLPPQLRPTSASDELHCFFHLESLAELKFCSWITGDSCT